MDDIECIGNSLDLEEFPCHPFDLDEKTGEFRYLHSPDCPVEVLGFKPCPYEERERMRKVLHDLRAVPRLLEVAFKDPGLAAGQNLLMRDIAGWEVPQPYIYHYTYVLGLFFICQKRVEIVNIPKGKCQKSTKANTCLS